MSLAVVSTLWMDIYSPEGILNTLLAHLGISAQPFIHSAKQALPSIAVMSVWQGVGYQMIIFLGGLQNINPALYEAAEMDHASAWQKFKDITLPELKPLLCVCIYHGYNRCVPYAGTADGHDRWRTGSLNIHTCI